jgi:hypothetical protein
LLACTSMERSSGSGYSDRSSQQTQSGWSKIDDSGTRRRANEPENVDAKIRLKQLENQLSSKRELEQYSKALPWFKSTEEKIDFLQAGDFEARQNWLNNRDWPGRARRTTMQMQEVVDAQDIALGMPENLVKKSWGEPQNVEVSGNPSFRNQRWRYSKYVSTTDGYKTEQKTVYFEGGKVVGWELN